MGVIKYYGHSFFEVTLLGIDGREKSILIRSMG
jgi:hypothetical protein